MRGSHGVCDCGSELNVDSVCMYVCLYVINRPRSVRMRPRATRKRGRPCFFRSLRSLTNALHSPSILRRANVKADLYLLQGGSSEPSAPPLGTGMHQEHVLCMTTETLKSVHTIHNVQSSTHNNCRQCSL